MYTIRKQRNLTTRQTSQKTREELTVLLAGLDQSMPQLIAQHPDGADFMPLFADRADAIARQADINDHQWLMVCLGALLEKNGKQDDEYLPPHDSSFA